MYWVACAGIAKLKHNRNCLLHTYVLQIANTDSLLKHIDNSVMLTGQSPLTLKHPKGCDIPFGCSIRTSTYTDPSGSITKFKHEIVDVESDNFAHKVIGLEYDYHLIAINYIHTEIMCHQVLLAHLASLNTDEKLQITLKTTSTGPDGRMKDKCQDIAFKFEISEEGALTIKMLEIIQFHQKNVTIIPCRGSSSQIQTCYIQHVSSQKYLKVVGDTLTVANLQEEDDDKYRFVRTMYFGRETANGSSHCNEDLFVFTFQNDNGVSGYKYIAPTQYIVPTKRERSGFCEVGLLKMSHIDKQHVEVLYTQADHRFFYHKKQGEMDIFECSVYPTYYLTCKRRSGTNEYYLTLESKLKITASNCDSVKFKIEYP